MSISCVRYFGYHQQRSRFYHGISKLVVQIVFFSRFVRNFPLFKIRSRGNILLTGTPVSYAKLSVKGRSDKRPSSQFGKNQVTYLYSIFFLEETFAFQILVLLQYNHALLSGDSPESMFRSNFGPIWSDFRSDIVSISRPAGLRYCRYA